ncbi:MAG: DUF4389 domain-containing protein [Candidatus Margulisbacteria bacterium]|nr:DUF4389 domain-containing protein [Candidatus Margulisiibacteriota bacterium]
MTDRKEILMRIIVAIISGIILTVWFAFIKLLIIINWIVSLIQGKRNRAMAELCEIWNSQAYTFVKYLALLSNKRPFPFQPLQKNMSEFEG